MVGRWNSYPTKGMLRSHICWVGPVSFDFLFCCSGWSLVSMTSCFPALAPDFSLSSGYSPTPFFKSDCTSRSSIDPTGFDDENYEPSLPSWDPLSPDRLCWPYDGLYSDEEPLPKEYVASPSKDCILLHLYSGALSESHMEIYPWRTENVTRGRMRAN